MNPEIPTCERTSDRSEVTPKRTKFYPLATGVGATSGVILGANLGNSVGVKVGAVVGVVTGAIVGGIVGDAIAEFTEEVIQETRSSLGLGANRAEIQLPAHYSWEQLRALSRPQS